MSNRISTRNAVAGAAIAIPLLWWGVAYLGRDLWWDEILSLRNYSLQALRDTVVHLKSTNNHILFNLVNNLFTRLIGERDFYDLMDKIHWLRALQLGFAAVTVIYTLAASRRFFGFTAAFLTGVVLVTTIPFLNFIMQLRGYGLSMMFLAMTLYHVWAFEEQRRRRELVIVLISVFALVYTMLSNVYFVLVLTLWLTAVWLRSMRWSRSRPSSQDADRRETVRQLRPRRRGTVSAITRNVMGSPHARLVGVIGGAMLLIALVYSSVVGDLLEVHARQLSARPPYRTYMLVERGPTVLAHFLSFRYALLIPFVGGCFLLLRGRRAELHGSPGDWRARLGQLAILLLGPFLVSFLRHEQPYDRTFIYLIPIFALLLGAGMAALLDRLPLSRRWASGLLAILYAYCIGTLVVGNHVVQERLEQNLHMGRREQDIMYNYYQSRLYQPGADTAHYATIVRAAPRPVIGYDDVDNLALSHYFNSVDVAYYTVVDIRELAKEAGGNGRYLGTFQRTHGRDHSPAVSYTKLEFSLPTDLGDKGFHSLYAALTERHMLTERGPAFYVITPFPEKFGEMMRSSYPQFRIRRLNEVIDYANLFVVSEVEETP